MDRPNWSSLHEMVDDLQRTIDNIDGMRKQMLNVSGEAWSDDRLVKATVGPRGQLVDLEIDPRVYRRPNSRALAASIVAAVRAAVEEAARKNREIIEANVPRNLAGGQFPGMDFTKLLDTHDTDLARGAANDERR